MFPLTSLRTSHCLAHASPTGAYRRYSKFRVLFFGLDSFSCRVFERLQAHPDLWDSLTVITKPDQRVGRHRDRLFVSPLKTLGTSYGHSVITIPESHAALRSWDPPAPFSLAVPPDPANILITASFGRILPGRLLSFFLPTRRINVHPSVLPAYRGPAPIQRALLNGETETGVSIIEMVKVLSKSKRLALNLNESGIDAGAVWAMQRVLIPPDSDFSTLRDKLAHIGGDLLVAVLRGMLDKTISSGVAQMTPTSGTPRAPLILPCDALVDFQSMSANDIVRRHRAISHHKPLTALLCSRVGAAPLRVQLYEPAVHSVPSPLIAASFGWYDRVSDRLLISCRDQSILAIPKLKSDSRALLGAKNWWNGAPRTFDQATGKNLAYFVQPPTQER